MNFKKLFELHNYAGRFAKLRLGWLHYYRPSKHTAFEEPFGY